MDLTDDRIEDEMAENKKIVSGILQKIASHNIQNPYFGRIEEVLNDMLKQMELAWRSGETI